DGCTCTVRSVSPIRPSQTDLASSIIASVDCLSIERCARPGARGEAGTSVARRSALGRARRPTGAVTEHAEDGVHLGVADGVGSRTAPGGGEDRAEVRLRHLQLALEVADPRRERLGTALGLVAALAGLAGLLARGAHASP